MLERLAQFAEFILATLLGRLVLFCIIVALLWGYKLLSGA
jgi:hypothetical protein